MDIQRELLLAKESKSQKYQRLFVGQLGYRALIKYELITMFTSWVPGALGLLLRSFFYPKILKSCGKNVTFGANVTLRHPNKISIANNVVVDENCVLDAKGDNNKGIFIGNNVFLGRNSIIYCQNGDIYIGDNANIGTNCQIASLNSVIIGKNVLIGAYTYLIGGGHNYENVDTAIINQGRTAKGITVKDNVWIGASVKVLDDIEIDDSAIVGAGAVVVNDVPEYAIVGGVPAKYIRDRRRNEVPHSS